MPLQNVFEIDVDIKQKTAINTPTVTQNDAVVFIFRILDGGRIYNIQSGTTFTLNSTRLDKLSVLTPGEVVGENVVQFELGTTELSVVGKVESVIQVYDAEGRVSTIPFYFTVLNDPSVDYVPSETENTLIQQVLGDGPQILADAEKATTDANASAGNANTEASNANDAASSANTAATNANTAANNANNATTNANNAATYANEQGDYAKQEADRLVGTDVSTLDTRITSIDEQLAQSNRQTQTLTHGTQVIGSANGTSSPLKVEFYGNTRINLLGEDGNFENAGSWTLPTQFQVSNEKSLYGINSLKSTISNSSPKAYKAINVDSTKYYITLVDVYLSDINRADGQRFAISENDYTGIVHKDVDISKINKWQTLFLKFTGKSNARMSVGSWSGASTSTAYYDGFRLYEISKATYDKIGVSLTDADVERMFPYVDSVQHVKNPVVKVEGGNILSATEDDWEIGTLSNGNPATSSANLRSKDFVRIVPSQQYARSVDSQYVISAIYFYDINKNYVSITGSATFTTPSNAHFLKVVLKRADAGNVELTEIRNAKPMLNLGSTAKPFVPKNSSFLYAETTLAGDSSKKDILSYNEDKRRWEKTKWWETDVVINGNLNLTNAATYTGYKIIDTGLNIGVTSSFIIVKSNGSVLETVNTVTAANITKGDQTYTNSSGSLRISISDADATGYDLTTTTGIKQYFTDKNYFLSYQLASPVIEEVNVEGDLVLNGLTQVTVGSGFSYTTDDEGNRTYTLTPENERYAETCNLTEVKATFANNIRTSLEEAVKKQSDIATDQSILKRQMLDVLIRLEALEGV